MANAATPQKPEERPDHLKTAYPKQLQVVIHVQSFTPALHPAFRHQLRRHGAGVDFPVGQIAAARAQQRSGRSVIDSQGRAVCRGNNVFPFRRVEVGPCCHSR
jgi:hypothetical protein